MSTRRAAMWSLVATAMASAKQQQPPQGPPLPPINPDEDTKLPNGKSQKNAIAKQEHEEALKDADDLIAAAEQLKSELQKAGDYVVPMSSVKKTEEIERLARKIRGRLKQ